MRTSRIHMWGLAALLAVVTVSVVSAPAAACPGCKAALEPSDDQPAAGANAGTPGNPARAYYYSILAMLTILSLVVGGLVRLMVLASREVPAIPPNVGPTCTSTSQHA